jgi:hypothetical protein
MRFNNTTVGLELDWAIVFLNEAFFYGQRKGDENDRFIVYHPPRDIYQVNLDSVKNYG